MIFAKKYTPFRRETRQKGMNSMSLPQLSRYGIECNFAKGKKTQ